MAMETAFRQIRDTIMGIPDRLPIDAAHRAMFRLAGLNRSGGRARDSQLSCLG